MDGVNWREVFAGFVLGMLPLAIRYLHVAFRITKGPGRRKYIGVLWAYHRSTMNSGQVHERQLLVKYSPFLDRIIFRTVGAGPTQRSAPSTSLPTLTYSGQISLRKGLVRYITLRDSASHEEIVWYVIDPFFDPFRVTAGLYLALDLRGLPVAGPMLLSQERLAIAEAEGYLENQVLKVEPILPPNIYGYGGAREIPQPHAGDQPHNA